jgi:hypothetical protein
MASLVLNGSTSGSITISSPAVSGVNVLSLPANTGTVITTGSTFAGTGPAFSAYQSASNQTYSATTDTKIVFDIEEFDTNSNFASNRFTPTVAGYYQVNAAVSVNSVSGNCYIAIYKNGSPYKRTFQQSQAVSFLATALVYCNGSTDYIEAYFTNGTGSSFTSNNVSTLTWFQGSMTRAA